MNNIPKGYKLVPVEPTEEILTALIDTWFAAIPIDDQEAMAQAYKTMLDAAPAPPQPIYDEAKERELFEIHYRAEYEENSGNELSDFNIKSMRDGTWYGASRHYLNGQWAGWKACAQSRAKAGEVDHE